MSDSFETQLNRRGLRLSDVAKALRVSRSTVTRWNQTRVPVDHLVEIERVTGIPRSTLRPDLFRPQPEAIA